MIRILIVEDSATVRKLLTALLQSDPALQVVGSAANGEEAVRQTLALKPDLITMDIHMPVMDGIEATRRIMTECPTPIVVLTAGGDELVVGLTAAGGGWDASLTGPAEFAYRGEWAEPATAALTA